MSQCCEPGDFDLIFNSRYAQRDARDYRDKGLSDEARRIYDSVRARIGEGATVLEVGGGIGAIQLELLRAGASHATNVELAPAFEPVASDLIATSGAEGRVTRIVADFVARAREIPHADAVILQRVVCCYPDAAALVSAAARHTQRVLVMTLPVDAWWMAVPRAFINVWPRLRGSKFRFFVHATSLVIASAEGEAVHLVDRRKGVFWQMLVFAR